MEAQPEMRDAVKHHFQRSRVNYVLMPGYRTRTEIAPFGYQTRSARCTSTSFVSVRALPVRREGGDSNDSY